MVVNMGIPMRYIIPPSMTQPPPPPVRTSEYPPPARKQNYAPSVRTNKPKKVQYEDDYDEEEDEPSDDEEYDEPPKRASRNMTSKKPPPRKERSPPPPTVQEDDDDEEKKPKDPTSRLKKLVKRSKDFKNIRKRLTARGEVYRPNRKHEQQQLPEVQQVGGAFPALLIPALTALAPFAGEIVKDVYNAIKRKIKGEGNVRQKMGRRLKTKQERLEFVVEILKKLKL